MWSPWYGYFEIRSSATYAESKDAQIVRQVLDKLPALTRTAPQRYGNAPGYDWVEITLADSPDGNFAVFEESDAAGFTLLAIVCGKSDDGQVPVAQLELFKQIACELRWELVDEDEEDKPNVVRYCPA